MALFLARTSFLSSNIHRAVDGGKSYGCKILTIKYKQKCAHLIGLSLNSLAKQELHRINICPAHLAGTNLGETEIHARGSTNTNTNTNTCVVLQIQIQIQIHAWFNSLNGIPAVWDSTVTTVTNMFLYVVSVQDENKLKWKIMISSTIQQTACLTIDFHHNYWQKGPYMDRKG